MAEPSTGGVPRWPFNTRGQPARPNVVSSVVSAPDPGGHGGATLLGNLIKFYELGTHVYDRYWGKGKAEQDALQATRLQLMEQRGAQQAERIHKGQQAGLEQAVETSSGAKFTPETSQFYPEAQDVYMNRPGVRALPATQGVPGTEGTTPGAPATATTGLGNLVVSPYRVIADEAPKALQTGTDRFREASMATARSMPPGPARERLIDIAQGPGLIPPSEVPKVYKGISEAGTAAGTEELKDRERLEARGTDAAMARYRGQVQGHPAGMLEDLHEALGYSSAGRQQLATLTQQQRQFLATQGDKIALQREAHKKTLEAGKPDDIRASATLLNQMEWGFATAGGLPTVTIHPTIKTDPWFRSPSYSSVPIEVPVEVARLYTQGQLDPRNPDPQLAARNLFWLAGIEHGILPTGGQFTPEQAKVMKDYISRYPGVTPDVRDWALASVDGKTAQAPGAGPGGTAGPPSPRGLQPVPGYTPPPPPTEQPALRAPAPTPPAAGVPAERFTPPAQPTGPARTPVPGSRRGAQLTAPQVAPPAQAAPVPVAPQAPTAPVPVDGQRFPEPPMPPLPLPIGGQAPPAQAAPPASGGWRLKAPPVTPPAYGQPGTPRSMFQRQPAAPGAPLRPGEGAIPPPAPVVAPQLPAIASPRSGTQAMTQPARPLAILLPADGPDGQREVLDAARVFGIDPQLLAALRRTENGGPGRQFGVLEMRDGSPPPQDYRGQARVAAESIRNNLARYRAVPGNPEPIDANGRYTDDFLRFFSSVYAPVKGATNDPKRKNVNHYPNLVKFYAQARPQ